jgi:NitT/TauT family transport system permease protein
MKGNSYTIPLKGLITPFDRVNKQVFFVTLLIEWALILVVWQINGNDMFPKPVGIFSHFLDNFQNPLFYDDLLTSLTLTVKGIFWGTVLALLISYAYVLGALRPIVEAIIKLRYLPLTGVVFVVTLLSHSGSNLKLILILIGIVPYFVTSMVSIISDINPQLYDLSKTLRMNRWQTLYRVVIMGKRDAVFEVMKQNFAICWLMITMVEGLSMSEGGIGTILIKQNKVLNMDYVFSIQLTLFLIGMLFDWLFSVSRNNLFKYVPLQKAK